MSNEPSDREILWRNYALHVDLYRFHMDGALKFNVFYYAITGAIVSYYFTHSAEPLARWSLVLPMVLSLCFASISFYTVVLVNRRRQDVFSLRDQLGLGVAPDLRLLAVIQFCLGIVHLIAFLILLAIVGNWLKVMAEEKVTKSPESAQAQPLTPTPFPPKESPLRDAFFDLDKAVLRDDAKAALEDTMRWLKANPNARIVVEGHSDERGPSEYNLALAQRRATAVRDYLVASSIDPERISTISYGEERPFVAAHDESAWKWNRRGHVVLVAP